VNANAGSYILTLAKTPLLFYPAGGTNCVHVDSVVDGHIAAFEKGRPGERYILGGENLHYREMLAIIADVLGRPRPRFAIPARPSVLAASLLERIADLLGSNLKLSAEAARAGGLRFFYSSDKARRELGLEDIPFRRAVEDAVAWYRKEGYLS
jgi:dihydroflavonol-4-reductase